MHKYTVSSHRVRVLIHAISILLFFQIVRGIFRKERQSKSKTKRQQLKMGEYRHLFKSLTSSTDRKLLGELNNCAIYKRKKQLLQKKFNRLKKKFTQNEEKLKGLQTEHECVLLLLTTIWIIYKY